MKSTFNLEMLPSPKEMLCHGWRIFWYGKNEKSSGPKEPVYRSFSRIYSHLFQASKCTSYFSQGWDSDRIEEVSMPLCHMPGIFPNIAQTISIISKMFYNYAFLPSFLSTPFFSILHRVVHSTSYSSKLSIIIHWALKILQTFLTAISQFVLSMLFRHGSLITAYTNR